MAENKMVQALVYVIDASPCRVIYSGYTPEVTCVIYAGLAKNNIGRWGESYREVLMAGGHLCDDCRRRVIARKALLGSAINLTITDALLAKEKEEPCR